jgi:hypothetical protein
MVFYLGHQSMLAVEVGDDPGISARMYTAIESVRSY